MDTMGGGSKNLIQELLQGLEFAMQLQIHLHEPSTSHETRDLLIHKIISAFEKALQIVNCKVSPAAPESLPSQPPLAATAAIRMSEESPPLSGSPRSEDSDRDFRDHDPTSSRKRKSQPRWTKQIRVNPGRGVEGPLDDGYSWRKYGQKDILGAIYPRGYYRCTHRNVQGCLATKQVQRSDEDPTVFEITYRGKHTCTAATSPRENQQDPITNTNTNTNTNTHVLQSFEQQQSLLNLRQGLRVQTENLDQSFHFPSSTSTIKTETQVFPPHHPMLPAADNFASPSYLSPAASAVSHFSVSTSGVHSFGGHPNFATSSASQIISAATSASNSPTVGLELTPFDPFEFDGHNFTFDNARFFS